MQAMGADLRQIRHKKTKTGCQKRGAQNAAVTAVKSNEYNSHGNVIATDKNNNKRHYCE
jgi:hypothetical protein